ncbi:S1-like domain-containing RNA-binding protein [Helicobacter sp. faydin-H20]|uniref:S1-like domain-containing RNA-binding protein n=1 Tax=Helicobacter anatolicus TaxID=2905874 RepID=UPI001E2FFFD3|nr:S1-like domain-containing RNA-binding protein [Helicobacter anatolicus]MCE3037343.1 S1-like domain-containing RNA-binding protein [Helicobacter anatolicus]
MKIGCFNTLKITSFTSFGAYLSDEDQNKVLLPKKFLQENFKLNDIVKVFVYTDSEDRIVATTQTPLAQHNEIAFLHIKNIDNFGCFLDIGLDKDIFMPTKNPNRFKIGDKVCVFITLDKQNRMIAKLGIKEHLKPFKNHKKRYMKLPAIAFEKTPLGIGCIVDKNYYGILYHNELKAPINFSESIHVYIQKIRKDGKLDLKLDYQEQKNALKTALQRQKILDFNYDTPTEIIQQHFKMSKKLFKKTLTELIEQKYAKLENNKIYKLDNRN